MRTHEEITSQRRKISKRTLDKIKELVPTVLNIYPVQAAYVYGSVARGTITPLSDVDIALLISGLPSPKDRLEMEITIQGEIESKFNGKTFDVRSINQAPLMIKADVVQHGILIYEGDRLSRIAFEVLTRQQYFDFAPTRRRLSEAFLRHIHEHGLIDD